MQVNSISNNSFKSKPFRLISTAVNYDRAGSKITNFRNCGKYVQEYNNPKAKELYEQAQKTKNIKEQIRLYDEMGHYELKHLNIGERIKEAFDKFLSTLYYRG